MSFERARQRKLAELVPNHVFRDIHRNMLLAVIVNPTKVGRTVERRDQVLTGRLSLVARTVSTFFNK
jgi:hypothetical protein